MRKSCLLMKTILALCLCLALLAGTACAEEMKSICSGLDYLYYSCTLADGRLLLTGVKNRTTSDYYDPVAWVVCLNPDGTVSWEFDDQGADGYSSVVQAAALRDGTVPWCSKTGSCWTGRTGLPYGSSHRTGRRPGRNLNFPRSW